MNRDVARNFKCDRCGKKFPQSRDLKRHTSKKSPCTPILELEDLPEDQKNNPNKCMFCNRPFVNKSTMIRHIRENCKIAPRNGDTSGMDKLYEHVLRKQEKEKKEIDR